MRPPGEQRDGRAAQAVSARKELISLRITWDESFNTYSGNVEGAVVKPEDIMGLALPLLDKTTHKLAPPLEQGPAAAATRQGATAPQNLRRPRRNVLQATDITKESASKFREAERGIAS